jgi:hypothetical protein
MCYRPVCLGIQTLRINNNKRLHSAYQLDENARDWKQRIGKMDSMEVLLHDAFFSATWNAISLLKDVKYVCKHRSSSDFPDEFFSNQTVLTNLHVLKAELVPSCKKNCIV